MGRYRNIDKEERLCNLCNEGIGDEEHYLTTCSNPTIKALQNRLINSVCAIKPTLIQFPKSPLFIYILSRLKTRIYCKLQPILSTKY